MGKSILALIFVSLFPLALSILFSYSVPPEIQEVKLYSQLTEAPHLLTTVTFTGNFVKVTFSLLVIVALILLSVFKKCSIF